MPCTRSGYLLGNSCVVLTSVTPQWSHGLGGVSTLPPWRTSPPNIPSVASSISEGHRNHFLSMSGDGDFSVSIISSTRIGSNFLYWTFLLQQGLLFTLPFKSSLKCYIMVRGLPCPLCTVVPTPLHAHPHCCCMYAKYCPCRPVSVPKHSEPGIFMSCSFLCLHKPRTMWQSMCFTNIYPVLFVNKWVIRFNF